jgi:hypothetical protein
MYLHALLVEGLTRAEHPQVRRDCRRCRRCRQCDSRDAYPLWNRQGGFITCVNSDSSALTFRIDIC